METVGIISEADLPSRPLIFWANYKAFLCSDILTRLLNALIENGTLHTSTQNALTQWSASL